MLPRPGRRGLHHATCYGEICPVCGVPIGTCNGCAYDFMIEFAIWIPCTACHGSGKIYGPDFYWVEPCQFCGGTGAILSETGRRKQLPIEGGHCEQIYNPALR